VVFSDGGNPSEYYVAIVLISAVYLTFGAVAGFWAVSWRAGLWLTAPAVFIIVFYSLRENHRLLLHLAVIGAAVGPGLLGAYAGERHKHRRI